MAEHDDRTPKDEPTGRSPRAVTGRFGRPGPGGRRVAEDGLAHPGARSASDELPAAAPAAA